MKKRNFLITVIASIMIISTLSLTSCGEPPTEDEAKTIAETLITASYELNDIYFGEGMPHVETSSSMLYADVSDDAPYKTEAELREATLAVFTENYADSIFRMYLSGYSDDDTGDVIFPRYVESGYRLTINLGAEPLIKGKRTYDFDSTVIKKCTAKIIIAEIDTLVDGEADMKVEVTIRYEERTNDKGEVTTAWRIDSPTY